MAALAEPSEGSYASDFTAPETKLMLRNRNVSRGATGPGPATLIADRPVAHWCAMAAFRLGAARAVGRETTRGWTLSRRTP